MELEKLRDRMKNILKESRYKHSLGVEEVAYDLALLNGYDTEKASIAGILHDCAKCLTDEQLLKECEKYCLPVKEIELLNRQLLHAKLGAVYAEKIYGVKDQEILDSITFHTTGRPGMTVLEKIIFIADYIEPYRKPLPGIEEIRKMAYEDLDPAIYMITENILKYLNTTGAQIDTMTAETYEYYKAVVNDRSK
jgi:predicted HD superfamily hydrolase involved in NAD metabolism